MDNMVQWPGWQVVRPLEPDAVGAIYELHRNVAGTEERAALKVITVPDNARQINNLLDIGCSQESISQLFKSRLDEILGGMVMLRLKDHPNVLHWEEPRCEQHQNGMGWTAYIQTELLTPLPQAIHTIRGEEPAIRLAMQLCNAVAHAESKDITHGNINPKNVFATADGKYKLGGFRTVPATQEYLAPEVCSGQSGSSRSDVYSLGMVLYWIMNRCLLPFMPVTAQIPSEDVKAAALNRRLSGEALPRTVNGSDRLWKIVEKACAFSPADRYANAQEMSEDLSALLRGTSTVKPMAAPVPQPQMQPAAQTPPAAPAKQPQMQPAAPAKQPKHKAAPAPKAKKTGVLPWILATIAVLMVCAVVALYLFGHTIFGTPASDDDSDVTEPTETRPVQTEPVQTEPLQTEPVYTFPPETQPTAPTSEMAGTYDIKVWVSESIVDLTAQQIKDFNATNEYGITINATIEPVGEGDAATSMLNDIQYGADLFGFAQDQTARLIQGGALTPLGIKATEMVMAAHDKASITAVTAGDQLYGYPMTSDNGYFMYYDKSVIPEDAVGSLEAIIAACEASGRNFSFELENSWYTVSFFFGAGCISEWQTDADGRFISVNDNFCSDKGLIAARGMQKLLTSKCYVNSSATSDFEAAIPSAVVVSGTWNYENAKYILGDNLGIAELPSFEVDGKSYHLGSFNGCKLLGIKPQTSAKRAAALNQLALYLTSEKCQLERFNDRGWGPSNLAAQGSAAVKAAPHLTALMAQNAYSRPQGQIHGSWWDIAKLIAVDIKDGKKLEDTLYKYYTSMNELFQMSDEVMNAWTVIGSIAGTNWDTDLPMVEQDNGVWKSAEAYTFDEYTEFKVRQGKSWDNNYGIEYNGANASLAYFGLQPGTYYIYFNPATGQIALARS